MSVFLLLGLITFSHAQGSDSFELEDIMSFSFPSHLAVSPVGDRVAWIFNKEGRRNVWVAEGPGYEARLLTQYTQDDGQEPDIFSDGKADLFQYGSEISQREQQINCGSGPTTPEVLPNTIPKRR